MAPRQRLLLSFGALAFLVLAGCAGKSGPPTYKIKGKVTKDGAPLTVTPLTGRMQVTFMRQDAAGGARIDPQEAITKPDGTFTLEGTGGGGIQAGKYKVAVQQWDPFPTTDKLGGAFNEKNTPIEIEVKPDQDINIELNTFQGERSAQ